MGRTAFVNRMRWNGSACSGRTNHSIRQRPPFISRATPAGSLEPFVCSYSKFVRYCSQFRLFSECTRRPQTLLLSRTDTHTQAFEWHGERLLHGVLICCLLRRSELPASATNSDVDVKKWSRFCRFLLASDRHDQSVKNRSLFAFGVFFLCYKFHGSRFHIDRNRFSVARIILSALHTHIYTACRC